MSEWYADDTVAPEHWWAVEHAGHPAFYLRALMPGDFSPGRLPLERHVARLDGSQERLVPLCGTCGTRPLVEALEPIERPTGARGFLAPFRERRAPWPKPTDPNSCWLCSDRRIKADIVIDGYRYCARCAAHERRK